MHSRKVSTALLSSQYCIKLNIFMILTIFYNFSVKLQYLLWKYIMQELILRPNIYLDYKTTYLHRFEFFSTSKKAHYIKQIQLPLDSLAICIYLCRQTHCLHYIHFKYDVWRSCWIKMMHSYGSGTNTCFI